MSIVSPCIGVCALDHDDVCIGCFRTADDITEWSQMSEEEQREVIVDSAARAEEKGLTL